MLSFLKAIVQGGQDHPPRPFFKPILIRREEDAGKALQAIFAGKYLRTHNNVEVGEDGLVLVVLYHIGKTPPIHPYFCLGLATA